MSAHATYAPSSAKRWMNCTASAMAISKIGEQEEGEEAQVGTAAHDEIDRVLGHMNGLMWSQRNCITTPNPNHPAIEGIELFLDYVSQLGVGRVWVEQRVTLTEQIWGRCDFAHWDESTGILTIVDYKNGYVPVEASSEQLSVYAAAIIYTMQLHGVRWVRLAVVQPHDWRPVPRVKQKVISADELYQFALKAAAIPDGPKSFKAGEHCRYCPLFGRCDASRDLLEQLAVVMQHPANKVPPSMIEPMLLCRKPVEDWFKGLSAYGAKLAQKGIDVPGMVIVEGQKHRVWNDPVEARKLVIEKLGVDALDLPSPAQVESKGVDVTDLAHRPEGGPALAFASDTRPRFKRKTAEEMFAGVAAQMAGVVRS